jgi:hypothetical protein
LRQHSSAYDDIFLDNALTTSSLDFGNVGGLAVDWEDPDIHFAFANIWDPQKNDGNVQFSSLVVPSPVNHLTTLVNQTVQVRQIIPSPTLSIPSQPTSTIRILIQRPNVTIGTQRIANLILHTLKSYPLMLLRHQTLPPFIHPSLVFPVIENKNMEPVNNCISLVHMISSGVQVSAKLFWKNVRLECERFYEEVS